MAVWSCVLTHVLSRVHCLKFTKKIQVCFLSGLLRVSLFCPLLYTWGMTLLYCPIPGMAALGHMGPHSKKSISSHWLYVLDPSFELRSHSLVTSLSLLVRLVTVFYLYLFTSHILIHFLSLVYLLISHCLAGWGRSLSQDAPACLKTLQFKGFSDLYYRQFPPQILFICATFLKLKKKM